jgi:hypothetical protein
MVRISWNSNGDDDGIKPYITLCIGINYHDLIATGANSLENIARWVNYVVFPSRFTICWLHPRCTTIMNRYYPQNIPKKPGESRYMIKNVDQNVSHIPENS